MDPLEETLLIAAGEPDTGTSLRRMLRVLGRAAGARAGTISVGGEIVAIWEEDSGGADPLQTVSLPAKEPLEGLLRIFEGGRHQLVLPLLAAGGEVGRLALLLAVERREPAVEEAKLLSIAAAIALVLEHERLLLETRAAQEAGDRLLLALNHELRTPATEIILEADLLRDARAEGLPPELERGVEHLESHVEQLVRVLHGVSELATAASTPPLEQMQLISPREFAREMLHRVEPIARRKELRLVLRSPPALPVLQIDSRGLARALLHLLTNAVRFTPAGSVELRLAEVVVTAGATRRTPAVAFQVVDSGVGIAREQLAAILEPFGQVGDGARTSSRRRGIGLGLSVARRSAQAMGGDLTLESQPGRGTTATLTIPCRVRG
jgi:signal transduction histidine kinase